MGLDMKKMREKRNALKGKGGGNKNLFWKPQDGDQTIRILPTSDGDPFKEYWFYYNLDKAPVLCPKRNFGEDSPVLDFATQLYREGTPESIKMAKDLFPKQRFFSPVLVRGEESQGVRIWGYSKTVYEQLLNLVLNPDYGDITDVEEGTDLVLSYGKAPGAMFPSTKLTPKRKTSSACQEGNKDCVETLKEIPEFEGLFERKTTAEVKQLLDRYMSGESETSKYNSDDSDKKEASSVDKAFNDLLGSDASA
tara:strand:+ start:192 stop:944 length:753 start_codon:yes stop_codon:yes gene_type:complete